MRTINWEMRQRFVDAVRSEYGDDIDTITRQQVVEICEMFGFSLPHWLLVEPALRAGHGVYRIGQLLRSDNVRDFAANIQKQAEPDDEVEEEVVAPTPSRRRRRKASMPHRIPEDEFEDDTFVAAMAVSGSAAAAIEEATLLPVAAAVAAPVEAVKSSLRMIANDSEPVNLVPQKMTGYVPFGHFNDVRTIIKSGRFYPVFITGLSGNGKTMMVEQACAAEKAGCIRVNVTIETDEDDLIGGMRLEDGHTVWHDGPVIQAMLTGSKLLLDEVDLGGNRLMCLQPILEGHGLYLKKTGRYVTPAPGFNVFATANTKGKGSEDGRFVGTNILNEAFLERFSITLEQEYPNAKTEQKILNNVLAAANVEDTQFTDKLVQWAEVIRKSFNEGAISEIISTRRLVHICEAFTIFGRDREKAITLCLNRFDTETKISFLDLYKKLDETLSPVPVKEEAPIPAATAEKEEIAF